MNRYLQLPSTLTKKINSLGQSTVKIFNFYYLFDDLLDNTLYILWIYIGTKSRIVYVSIKLKV